MKLAGIEGTEDTGISESEIGVIEEAVSYSVGQSSIQDYQLIRDGQKGQ